MKKRYIIIFVLMAVILALAFATDKRESNPVDNICNSLIKEVTEPSVSSLGGEWTVTALARADYSVPEGYFEKYYSNLCTYLKENNGVLHENRYTEYSRVIIALSAIGASPQNVEGYNLLVPLSDYKKTVRQGINGIAFALLALDSGKYELPQNPDAEVQATREMYVNELLKRQDANGGFSFNDEHDIDLTAIVLQALSKYRESDEVDTAVERGISALSAMFLDGKAENAESVSQVVMALCELGIDFSDERFIKDGKTVYDMLCEYTDEVRKIKKSEILTVEQLLYANVNCDRIKSGKSSFYDMSDVEKKEYKNAIIVNAEKEKNSQKSTETEMKCTVSIRCDTVFDNMDKLDKNKADIIPENGIIYEGEVVFSEGETVFEVVKNTLAEKKIPFEFEKSPAQKSIYIEGINNLYEFDCGELSGWLYRINGNFPEKSMGDYILENEDAVEILYSCDSGKDIGKI